MTTTMTSAQFAWKQFSAIHIQREGRAHEHLADDREECFDMPVPITASKASTSKTSPTTSRKSKRVQFSTTGHLIDTNKRTAATAATTATISLVAPAAGFEQVKKAKTRSERRAEDPEVEPEAEEPIARKERRSDYWVQRDNLRRDNARMMKNQFQDFE
jgi:hypothetical protein